MNTKKEGNLEAPTRHPLDWKNPTFYDKDDLHQEMERVFRYLSWLSSLSKFV